MTNCNITIEIQNFQPKNLQNIQYSDLLCLIKLDNFEGKINLNEYSSQKVNHIVKNIKKDIKYNIRLMNIKSNSLIGISDLIIPLTIIKKTEINSNFEINKSCSLTMIESTKRLLFGSVLKERNFIIEIKSNVEVLSKSKTKSFFVRNSTSFPTMPSSIQSKKSFFKNNMNLTSKIQFNTQGKNSIENEFKRQYNFLSTPPNKHSKKKTNFEQNEIKNYNIISNSNKTTGYQTKRKTPNSIRREFFGLKIANNKNKSRQKENLIKQNKSKSITYETSKEFNCNNIPLNNVCDENNNSSVLEKNINDDNQDNYFSDLSTIDQLLINNIENENLKEKLDNGIYSAFNTFKSNYSVFIKNNNEGNLDKISQKNIKANIETLIKYYTLVMEKISIIINQKNKLKSLYYSNLEKYIYIKKELNLLKRVKINWNIKQIKINLNQNINNKIIKKQTLIKKNEYKLFLNIFDIFYLDFEINKNKEDSITNNLTEEDKKKLLLSSVKSSINSYGNISQIFGDDEDSKIRLKALLFRYNIKEKEENLNSFQINEPIIEMGSMNIGKLNIDKIKAIKEVDEEKEEDSEENNMTNEEKIDLLIQKFLNQKNRKIKFEKINPFQYKYGSLNVYLKIDDDNQIFVQFGNGYITLEKFVEKNEKNEENKLKNKGVRMYKSFNKSSDFKKSKKVKQINM